MKTKHKRLIIIGSCITWGMLTLSLPALGESLLWNGCKQLNLLGYICFFSTIFTGRIIMFFDESLKSEPTGYTIFFVVQFLFYTLIGIIVAYAPWRKTKPIESSTPPEPDK